MLASCKEMLKSKMLATRELLHLCRREAFLSDAFGRMNILLSQAPERNVKIQPTTQAHPPVSGIHLRRKVVVLELLFSR